MVIAVAIASLPIDSSCYTGNNILVSGQRFDVFKCLPSDVISIVVVPPPTEESILPLSFDVGVRTASLWNGVWLWITSLVIIFIAGPSSLSEISIVLES